MSQEEIWKSVTGRAEGYFYEVSNLGRVRHFDTREVKNTQTNSNGYSIIQLFRDGERKTCTVHSLVTDAFLGSPPGRIGTGWYEWQVNHKDGDKTNNCVENLEWVTGEGNHEHASRTGLISHNYYTREDVINIWNLYYEEGKTCLEISDIMGMPDVSVVTRIINGDRRRSITKNLGEPCPRKVRGENMGNSQLKKEEVLKIRDLYKTGDYTYQEIADIYGVNKTTIGRIVKRKTWKHI